MEGDKRRKRCMKREKRKKGNLKSQKTEKTSKQPSQPRCKYLICVYADERKEKEENRGGRGRARD